MFFYIFKLEAKVGQKSLTWIRLIVICYIVPWPPSWILELNDLSNSEFPCPPIPPIKFRLNLIYGLWIDVDWKQSGQPPWLPSLIPVRYVFSNSHLHNTSMPPIKFKLNPTYRSQADVIWRFSRWLPWWPSWLSRRNHFSNSKSSCCPDALHHVSA